MRGTMIRKSLRTKPSLLTLFLLFFASVALLYADTLAKTTYPSTADDSMQPAIYFAPKTNDPVPLVVGLHSWSYTYRTEKRYAPIAKWCIENNWAYIQPDFRGQNNRPEATASELVVQDILDAVTHAKTHANINEEEIFIFGFSGGGMAALLMAGRHPELWAGVSAWVPIVDLAQWHGEAPRRYKRDMEASCGGPPGATYEVDKEYRNRSPITYLGNARSIPVYISAGILDGHGGRSVPISHSFRAFNELADSANQITEEDIHHFVQNATVPLHLQEDISNPLYGENKPLFTRGSHNVTLTIFDGGHEIITDAVMPWFESIRSTRLLSRIE